ncbi:hypothetical protein [Parasitella parasitica]|uniref:Stress response protein NST1 n=1 Tax=Parasitella parasitica TaxID=35722 RepID=A0A0B7N9I6_9FUNG|nr:hypothetical protein [Parasitella parasitica]
MKNTKDTCSTQKKKNARWLVDKPERSDIWTSTNYTEERQRIREFWLQLSEEERRSLVKVEKDAVLRKMKEQQRHSCNCSVCGKKRSAIEDELEVLYDAYYEELEQYAYRQQQNGIYSSDSHSEDDEEDDEDVGEYDDEQVDDDDDDDDDGYRSDSIQKEPHFSKTLTVKGSIITVADDLLKNDGKKFLDMIEKLDERKMLKERQAANSHLFNEEDEEEDEDEDDDENEDEESDGTDDEDNDADGHERVNIRIKRTQSQCLIKVKQDLRTEEQRMEEGRKMFQIFAARMFEQRVLTAYREKVAQDRQKRLIEELEEEDRQRQERERKKQQDKEKKKDKKRQLKLQQEQERLELEKKKKEEELAAEALRLQQLEHDRQIKEQERLKRDQEKRQKEEEKLRKEEEKKKRRLKEEKAKAAEKEKRRKEEEELKKKQAEEKLNQERKRKLHNTKISQEEEEEGQASSLSNAHHLLSDSSSTADIIPNRRRISVAGPIGSPIKTRPISSHIASNDTANRNSFFSNFLFGPIQHNKPSNRRYSAGGDGMNASLEWTNGWTPLTALSDNVHDKLFGDVIFTGSLILERAKSSYQKLDEIALIKYFVKPNYHPLNQLHQMLRELYHQHPDIVSIDPRELYQILNQPSSGFQCIQHQQHGCVVRLLDKPSSSPPPPPSSNIHLI